MIASDRLTRCTVGAISVNHINNVVPYRAWTVPKTKMDE